MSNKNDASLESTKQMLDELDALMEKMLSLPVTEAEEGRAPAKSVAKAPPMSAKLTFLPPMNEKPAPINPPKTAPAPAEHPPLNPPHLAAPSAPPPPQPQPFTNEVLPPSAMAKLEPLLAALSDDDAPAAPHRNDTLLLWLNQTFDSATLALGGLGHWLRAPAGRMLLGFSGVVMLMVAVGWFLRDWLGWNW
jgi:hypothetical protein